MNVYVKICVLKTFCNNISVSFYTFYFLKWMRALEFFVTFVLIYWADGFFFRKKIGLLCTSAFYLLFTPYFHLPVPADSKANVVLFPF